MYLVKKIRSGEAPLTKHGGSMAQDIESGRETELDSMTGYVVRKAKELGVPVPVTESGIQDGEGRGVRRPREAGGRVRLRALPRAPERRRSRGPRR